MYEVSDSSLQIGAGAVLGVEVTATLKDCRHHHVIVTENFQLVFVQLESVRRAVVAIRLLDQSVLSIDRLIFNSLRSEQQRSRIIQRRLVFHFQTLMYTTQLIEFTLRLELADRDEAQKSPVSLKVTPFIVLDSVISHISDENISRLSS